MDSTTSKDHDLDLFSLLLQRVLADIQDVDNHDNSSLPASLRGGVQQGSRIDPHEFTVYTDDMSGYVK